MLATPSPFCPFCKHTPFEAGPYQVEQIQLLGLYEPQKRRIKVKEMLQSRHPSLILRVDFSSDMKNATINLVDVTCREPDLGSMTSDSTEEEDNPEYIMFDSQHHMIDTLVQLDSLQLLQIVHGTLHFRVRLSYFYLHRSMHIQ